MEIKVADQRILLFSDQITSEDAAKIGWEKKMDAFGALSKVTSFLSRSKDDDFELLYTEHRYQPFWHVIARARYVYDRSAVYQVPASGPEVTAVTDNEKKLTVTNKHFHLAVTEHCQEEELDEVFVNGVTGKQDSKLKGYTTLSPKTIESDLESYVPKGSILVPPQTRVSAIMRDSLAKMIKGIQADTIFEESVEVTCVDLYYHPIYAYRYKWKSKDEEAILEVDGMTGATGVGTRTFDEYMGHMLDRNFLFDIGADAAGLLVPGGSVAVKLAKKYIDSQK